MKSLIAILMTCPNDGGVFLKYNNLLYRLDDESATGVDFDERVLAVCRQPSSLEVVSIASNLSGYECPAIEDIHDVVISGDDIYLACTYDNQIRQLDLLTGSEVQRWNFPGESDAIHLNCLAEFDGELYFSAFGDFDTERGYKGRTEGKGYIQRLSDSSKVVDGLSQPHSITLDEDGIFVADSERKDIVEFSVEGEELRRVHLGGYTRGICVSSERIFVGLSCSRNIEDAGVKTATLVELDRESLKEISRTEIPAREIFSIKAIYDESLLYRLITSMCLRWAGKNSDQQLGAHDALREVSRVVLPKLIKDTENLREDLEKRENELLQREGEYGLEKERLLKAIERKDLEVESLKGSMSWKITRPLRALALFLRKIRGKV